MVRLNDLGDGPGHVIDRRPARVDRQLACAHHSSTVDSCGAGLQIPSPRGHFHIEIHRFRIEFRRYVRDELEDSASTSRVVG
jgi:hypothetical protein